MHSSGPVFASLDCLQYDTVVFLSLPAYIQCYVDVRACFYDLDYKLDWLGFGIWNYSCERKLDVPRCRLFLLYLSLWKLEIRGRCDHNFTRHCRSTVAHFRRSSAWATGALAHSLLWGTTLEKTPPWMCSPHQWHDSSDGPHHHCRWVSTHMTYLRERADSNHMN
jgi:hypothetical protein